MSTEVTVRIHDKPLGQAFFVQQEEWNLFLSEVRALLSAQEIETPVEYRFLTANGNVISPGLEQSTKFRDIVEREPFAEVEKDDTSLQSAEERVAPKIVLIAVGEASESPSNQNTETCPFLNKFPCFAGAKNTLPCMRNLFNVHTMMKIAFILTCLLFLMIFVLTLFLHLFFGIGAIGGYAGHGFFGGSVFHHQQQTPSVVDQEALTNLKMKMTEMEVASRFEIQNLKQKLEELEDMHLSQFKELEAVRKELAAAKASQSGREVQYEKQVESFVARLSSVEDSMVERWHSPKQHKLYTVDSHSQPEQEQEAATLEENEKEEVPEIHSSFDEFEAAEEEKKQEKRQKNKEDKKKDKGKKKDKKNKRK